ncbi:MAG: hypothetical protein Q8N23_32370 [Archangium sp.]|nr:hypothetical protein [Archangium sp.]MDP3572206.1 hypothetical protein [Archangium sp.]
MRFFFALAAVLLAGCFAPARSAFAVASPSVGVSVGQFDPYLDPYGAWLTVRGYGRVWQPAPQYVGSDFYPYGSGGQWVYTNAGWVFDSEYPFGWAVFHYGRWTRHFDYGWLWIPGSQWGPSWVSWRLGGPFVGWAPLGPRGARGVGYRDWCFVPSDRFTVRNVRAYSAGEYEFHRAVAVTAPSRMPGPPPEMISRATGSRVRQVPVDRLRSGGRVPPPRGRANTSGSSPRSAYPQGQLPPTPQQRYRSAPDSNDRLYRAPPPARRLEPMTPPPPPARYRASPPSPGAAPMTLPPPARAMPRAPSMPTSPPPPSSSLKRGSPPPASPAPRMAPPPPPPRGGGR